MVAGLPTPPGDAGLLRADEGLSREESPKDSSRYLSLSGVIVRVGTFIQIGT